MISVYMFTIIFYFTFPEYKIRKTTGTIYNAPYGASNVYGENKSEMQTCLLVFR